MTKPRQHQSDIAADLDFDCWHERKGTGSIKWEFQVRDGHIHEWDRADSSHGEARVLPMWVADAE